MLFCTIVITAILSPLILGLRIGGIVPRLPALDWTLTIDARTAAVAEAIHQPKIVFIGGSNIRFGVDATALSRDLNMPVINYGQHASLGIDVIADRALHFVNPGDIVVFAPELSHFRKAGATEFSDDLRIDFLAEHPSPLDPTLQSFPTREWHRSRSRCTRIRDVVEKFLRLRIESVLDDDRHGGVTGRREPSPYTLDAIGPDGSMIFPRPGPRPYEKWVLSDPPANVSAMELVTSRGGVAFALLKKACAERHCTLCVMPPIRLTIPDNPDFEPAEMLRMEQHFIDFAVANGAIKLMNPGDTVLPRADGYDTDYHLNDVGVKIMEPRIAAAMQRVLKR
jgi:hypothetical protein